jgi:hypothetical protein
MAEKQRATLADTFDQKVFDAIYSRALVYNTCWEDPAVDRQVLNIGADDRLLVITSAGCNVLDYVLLGPERSTRSTPTRARTRCWSSSSPVSAGWSSRTSSPPSAAAITRASSSSTAASCAST